MTPAALKARALSGAIGSRVRALRLSSRLSQVELARRAKMTQNFLGQVERGTANPSIATIMHLADGLGCEFADLLPLDQASGVVVLRAEDARRAVDAVSTLAALLRAPRRVRR